MKKILIILLAFLLVNVNAQETKIFEVNGVKTIFQPSVKNVVSVQLFIDGGTANYTLEKEGVEAIALDVVVHGGTTNNPKNEFFGKLEKMGSAIGSSVNYDYSIISLKCLKQSFTPSWELFVDAINNPAFNQKEFENSKNQFLANAQQAESDPDSHLRNITMQNVFKGMNYEKIPSGSSTSIQNITLDDVKEHYHSVLAKNKIVLVIVGNLNETDLKHKISQAFGKLKEVGKDAIVNEQVSIKQSSFNSETRDIATNYIRGYMGAPPVGTKDEVAMRLAMSILRDRFFKELRTERNLTYAPGAFFPSGIIHNPYLALYVSTDKPNESAQVMIDELRKIKRVGFTDKELFDKKGQFITHHYLQQETNASLASSIGQSYLSPGGLEHRNNFITIVDALTAEEISDIFRKYANAINWTYLGYPTIVDESIFLSSLKVLNVKRNDDLNANTNKSFQTKKSKKQVIKK